MLTNSVNVLSVQSVLVPYVIILQLYPNEINRFPFPAQCTSAVLTHTTVVSERLSHFAAGVLEEK